MRMIDPMELKRSIAVSSMIHDGKTLEQIIDEQPTIDERKTGRWIHDGYDHPHGVDWMHCSNCGRREPHVPAAMTNYCPSCGADMRDGKDEA